MFCFPVTIDLQKVGGLTDIPQLPQSSTTQDPLSSSKETSKGSLLKITRKEFEKEYEVK